jgi:hypothetical protein
LLPLQPQDLWPADSPGWQKQAAAPAVISGTTLLSIRSAILPITFMLRLSSSENLPCRRIAAQVLLSDRVWLEPVVHG